VKELPKAISVDDHVVEDNVCFETVIRTPTPRGRSCRKRWSG
jgi:hypothetical protein